MLAALSALLLVPGGSAVASDADVVRAWSSEDRSLNRASRTLSREIKAWERSRFRKTAGILRALRRLETITVRIRGRVRRADASSAPGAKARVAVLKSLGLFVASTRSLRAAVRYAAKGRRSPGLRALKKARRNGNASERAAKRAIAFFEQAGREVESRPAPPPAGGGGDSGGGDGGQEPPPGGGGDGGGDGGQEPPPEEPPDDSPLPTIPPLPFPGLSLAGPNAPR